MKNVYLVYPQKKGVIAPEIYGQFTELLGAVIYDGIWVGKDSEIPNIKGFRKDVIEKMRQIKVPVIRWPGGCFAEGYDWRDGIGENRPVRLNWWTPADGKYEPNEVGTHEFMDFCEAVGAKAYFGINITSATPLDARNWMDYCLSPRGSTTLALEREKNGHPEPFDIPYWGIGNECWGGGGNMTAEFYTNEFRRYAVVMQDTCKNTQLISSGANGSNYGWTRTVCNGITVKSQNHMNGYDIHYYAGMDYCDAVSFTVEDWYRQLRAAATIETLINRHWNIICGWGMQDCGRLVFGEWGNWHKGGSDANGKNNLFERQNTMLDAVSAACTLNIFNNHCDKVMMANISQMVNFLHSLFFINGKDCIVTPTYHIYDMYKEHQGAECVTTTVTDNEKFEDSISVSASVKDGKTLVTVCNVSHENSVEFQLRAVDMDIPETAEATILYNADIHAHNTYEQPEAVMPEKITVNPQKPITIPAASVLSIRF